VSQGLKERSIESDEFAQGVQRQSSGFAELRTAQSFFVSVLEDRTCPAQCWKLRPGGKPRYEFRTVLGDVSGSATEKAQFVITALLP